MYYRISEKYYISIYVTFVSSININRLPAQTIQYMSRNKVVETELRELASASRGRIPSGGTDEWPDEQLTVPPLPPTNLRGCHVIRIQYDVFVSILCAIMRSIVLYKQYNMLNSNGVYIYICMLIVIDICFCLTGQVPLLFLWCIII